MKVLYLIDCNSKLNTHIGFSRYSEHMAHGVMVESKQLDINEYSKLNVLAWGLKNGADDARPRLMEIACKPDRSKS